MRHFFMLFGNHIISVSCLQRNTPNPYIDNTLCPKKPWGFPAFYLLNKGIMPKYFSCFHDTNYSSLEIHFPVLIYSTSSLLHFLFHRGEKRANETLVTEPFIIHSINEFKSISNQYWASNYVVNMCPLPHNHYQRNIYSELFIISWVKVGRLLKN